MQKKQSKTRFTIIFKCKNKSLKTFPFRCQNVRFLFPPIAFPEVFRITYGIGKPEGKTSRKNNSFPNIETLLLQPGKVIGHYIYDARTRGPCLVKSAGSD